MSPSTRIYWEKDDQQSNLLFWSLGTDRGRDGAPSSGRSLDPIPNQDASVLTALPKAIRSGGISAVFQPIVRCGSVISFEALARWTSTGLGEVSPAVFIPAAEALGVVADIDELVLRHALSAARRTPGLVASVNVSSRFLMARGAVHTIEAALEMQSLPAAALAIEVADRELTQHGEAVKAVLFDLRRRGIQIVIDGVGEHALISKLHTVPFDKIKLKRSFARDLDDSSLDVICGIVALAKGFGARVAAKGVETYAQAKLLAYAGVEDMQGHYFGQPGELASLRHHAQRRHTVVKPPRPWHLAPRWYLRVHRLKQFFS